MLIVINLSIRGYLMTYPQRLYHMAGTVLRGSTHRQVDVTRHYVKSIYLSLVTFGNAVEDLFQALSYLTFQRQFPVLPNPHEVIVKIVDRMLSSLDRAHLTYTNKRIRLRRISAFLSPVSWRACPVKPVVLFCLTSQRCF